MGNQLAISAPGGNKPLEDVTSTLQNLPHSCALIKKMGGGRILKTMHCLYEQRNVVVKVYVKRELKEDLDRYARSVSELRKSLQKCPGVLTYQHYYNYSTAAYLIRPFLPFSLYDRLHSHPFLEREEQLWIAYQLLRALAAIHAENVIHGDLKAENVMLTSWNWLLLSDFAFYKPENLPADNPADFSAFYAVGSRQRCYIAPERFYLKKKSAPLETSGDIFSAGCVLAEMFMGGEVLFTLEQLLAYRAGSFQPALERITDTNVRQLVSGMLGLDPATRGSAQQCLDEYAEKVFPGYFAEYYAVMSELGGKSAQGKLEVLQRNLPRLAEICGVDVDGEQGLGAVVSCSKDAVLVAPVSAVEGERRRRKQEVEQERMEQVSEALQRVLALQQKIRRNTAEFGAQVSDIPGDITGESTENGKPEITLKNSPPKSYRALLLVTVITSCIRNCKSFHSKQIALELLHTLGRTLPDPLIISRVIPHSVAIVDHKATSAPIRALSLRLLTETLQKVVCPSSTQAELFPEYLFKAFSLLHTDNNLLVRLSLASSLGSLAHTARRFLETSLKPNTNYDLQLQALQLFVSRAFSALVNDTNSQVRAALLSNILQLAQFMDKDKTHSQLLPALIALLNHKSHALRAAFFHNALHLCQFVGSVTLHDFVLPCVEQALQDQNLAVLSSTLCLLVQLARENLLQDSALIHIAPIAASSLRHYSCSVRTAAVELFVLTARQLGPAKTHVQVCPHLHPHCRHPLIHLTKSNLLNSLLPPSTDIPPLLPTAEPLPPHFSQLDTLISSYAISSSSPYNSTLRTSSQTNANAAVVMNTSPYTQVQRVVTRLGNNPNLTLTPISKPAIRIKVPPSTLIRAMQIPQDSLQLGECNSRPPNNSSWKPRGVLIANLFEHRAPVTSLSTTGDHKFLLSASEDGTVKIWDSERVLQSVNSASQLTYTHSTSSSPIVDALVLQNSHSFVSAAADGSVHVCTVEHTVVRDTFKYIPPRKLREHVFPKPTKLLENAQLGICLVASADGSVSGWDLRDTTAAPFILQLPQYTGVPISMSLGGSPHSLLIGTSRGFVVLFDLRFRIPLRVLRHSLGTPIRHIAPIPGMGGRSDLIGISAQGEYLLGGFDLSLAQDQMHCSATLRARLEPVSSSSTLPRKILEHPLTSPQTTQQHVSPPSPLPQLCSYLGRADHFLRQELKQLQKPLPLASERNTGRNSERIESYISSSLVSGATVMTAGTDSIIRVWDMGEANGSYRMSAPRELVLDGHVRFKSQSLRACSVLEEVVSRDFEEGGVADEHGRFYTQHGRARGPSMPDTHHKDVITQLQCLEGHQRMLVSADRSGCIKAWV